jgi:hypothetical protein
MQSSDRKGRYITSEELNTIQEMNAEFSKAKMALGDAELQKQNILKHIDEIKLVFAQHEKTLIEKYGEDAIINIKTGEVTEKNNNNNI